MQEDKKGVRGVSIGRELAKTVAIALKSNLTTLGPQVLPYTEQFKFIIDFIRRKLSPSYRASHKPYIPDFRKAFQHYCIHAGGRAIIDSMEENLHLSADDVCFLPFSLKLSSFFDGIAFVDITCLD